MHNECEMSRGSRRKVMPIKVKMSLSACECIMHVPGSHWDRVQSVHVCVWETCCIPITVSSEALSHRMNIETSETSLTSNDLVSAFLTEYRRIDILSPTWTEYMETFSPTDTFMHQDVSRLSTWLQQYCRLQRTHQAVQYGVSTSELEHFCSKTTHLTQHTACLNDPVDARTITEIVSSWRADSSLCDR